MAKWPVGSRDGGKVISGDWPGVGELSYLWLPILLCISLLILPVGALNTQEPGVASPDFKNPVPPEEAFDET